MPAKEVGLTPAKRKRVFPLATDQYTLFSTLHNAFPSAAIFTVIPGFPQATLPSHEDESNLPLLLSSLYDCKYAECNPDELSQIVWHKLTDICFTTNHRQGCITASMFGRVAKCVEKKYPTSLIESIMQYTSPNPAIPASKWGRENVDRARKEYNTQMKADHANFSVKSSVL